MNTMTEEERLLSRTEQEIYDEIAAFMSDGVPRGSLDVSVEAKITINAASRAIDKMSESESYPNFHSRRICGRRVCWMS